MISKTEFLSLLAEVSLAPSAHNTQPAKWSYKKGFVFLTIEESRCLPIADPKNHDSCIGLGASILGMKIALAKRNLSLSDEIYCDDGPVYYTGQINNQENRYLNELSFFPAYRYSHRGFFKKSSKSILANIHDVLKEEQFLKVVTDKQLIKEIASDHDKASYSFLKQESYFRELFSWLRFKKEDTNYYRDGLNIDSMGLNFIEKIGAQIVMKPTVFNFFKTIGLGQLVTSEASKVSSASGLLIVCCLDNESYLKRGEHLYHSWLLLTKLEMSASPLSTIVDDPEYREKWSAKVGLPEDGQIINILKFGPSDLKVMPKRSRLAAEQILKDFEI